MNESQIYHEQTFTIPARVKTEWTVFGITRPRLLTMSPFGLLALSVYFLGDTLRLAAKWQIGGPVLLLTTAYIFFGAPIAAEGRTWYEFQRLKWDDRRRQHLYLYRKGE